MEFGEYVNDVFTSYRDVGAVKTEVMVQHNREVLDFESGRPLVTIIQEVIRESVMISGTLAELNLATIKSALGQGNVTSHTTTSFLDGSANALLGTLQSGSTSVRPGTLMTFGGMPSLAYIGIRFTHVKASGARQIFEGYKASPQGQLTLPFKESDWNTFEVSFRLLADTTRTAGSQYYQMFIEDTP